MKKISLFIPLALFVWGCNNIGKAPEKKATEPVVVKSQDNTLVASEASKKAAHDQLEEYRQRVLKGESMAELAKQYSEDPGSAQEGGLYRDIAKGVMVPEFESVAFSLKPGEVSEVFETQYGYHFIQLVDRRGDVVDVRHILIIPKAE